MRFLIVGYGGRCLFIFVAVLIDVGIPEGRVTDDARLLLFLYL